MREVAVVATGDSKFADDEKRYAEDQARHVRPDKNHSGQGG
jgi:hypothetical protein